jgi:phosphoribosylformylglycinamidine synthase subunit PurL
VSLAIASGQWREVALSDDEYELILEKLGREPTTVELGMFGAMWSEHCGYKHSRPLLKKLPTIAPWVLQGPGENAGAIDIGDGLAVVFKVESHNHPSAVEPYQGAATGVGGIVRDIFTMGARPIAILDSLRFGPLDRSRNRYLFENVVGGIGGYGNCLGIPTVGGEISFDNSFNGNPLVNAMCLGITKHDAIMRAKASGPGNIIMLIGADTGRDGVHGATFASVDDPEASHRGVIQVGNPFLEKLLLEACLELLQGDDVVAMQDLGAAGLTSSTVECASRGGVGAEIDVALVPRRAEKMTPYEIMLSESQERMLLVVRPEGIERVEEIVGRWSLHANAIGKVTDDGRVRVLEGSEVVADVPAFLFTDECPVYLRDAEESTEIIAARSQDFSDLPDLVEGHGPGSVGETLLKLLSSPNIGSRRPVFERYDYTIQTNTVVPPGEADAAVLRIKGSDRGIATAIDCNSRYCWLDPKLGTMLGVAEATRNISCSGATPLAITNCLNFGNPEKPSGYYQLARAIEGMAEACEALAAPVVSGNVSLYNETTESAVMPTPTIGVVGVLENVRKHATMRWKSDQVVLLLGENEPTLGGSEFLATVHGLTAGTLPQLNFNQERALQAVVRELIASGLVKTAHDCSLGGVAVALAEMAIISDTGVTINDDFARTSDGRMDAWWFGETASRVIVVCDDENADLIVQRCNDSVPLVQARVLGGTGGHVIRLGSKTSVSLERAIDQYESALTARF